MSRAVTLGLFLVCACGARKETLPDGGSLNGPVKFRVQFNSSSGKSLFLQLGRDQEWLEVHDSAGAMPISSACFCACSACAACTSCPDEKKRVLQVPAFSSTTYVWPGFVFPNEGTCGSSKCQTQRSANPGKYTAHYCWSTSADTQPDGQQIIGPATCQDVGFDYPPDGGEVSLEICDC